VDSTNFLQLKLLILLKDINTLLGNKRVNLSKTTSTFDTNILLVIFFLLKLILNFFIYILTVVPFVFLNTVDKRSNKTFTNNVSAVELVTTSHTYLYNQILEKSSTSISLNVVGSSSNTDYINYSLKKKLVLVGSNLNSSLLFYSLDYLLLKLLSVGFKSNISYVFKLRYLFSLKQTS
jgi:hypothetical protein